jgi:hypothetical protein
LLEVDQKFRVGLIIVFVGLTLVILGVYMESKDAKDAAEQAAALLPLLTG